jgi:hypothetical protein
MTAYTIKNVFQKRKQRFSVCSGVLICEDSILEENHALPLTLPSSLGVLAFKAKEVKSVLLLRGQLWYKSFGDQSFTPAGIHLLYSGEKPFERRV